MSPAQLVLPAGRLEPAVPVEVMLDGTWWPAQALRRSADGVRVQLRVMLDGEAVCCWVDRVDLRPCT